MPRKTAAEKMAHPAQPELKPAPEAWAKGLPNATMVIPTPRQIAQIIAGTQPGQLLTVGQLRQHLAAMNGADIACPLTTGIFLRVVAEYAESQNEEDLPWHRVLRDDASLNPKLPGYPHLQRSLLLAEGVTLLEKRGKWVAQL